MDAWRYGIYLLVFTFNISLEDKFHISACPCIILYLTHQIFSLVRDWSKLNMSHLKLGNIQLIFPNFEKLLRVAKNI